MEDSKEYIEKKKHFSRLITIFGRHSVMEALDDASITPVYLHLSSSNKSASILDDLTEKAKAKGATVKMHDKAALSRISKNAKQDQGVALDIQSPNYSDVESYLENLKTDAKIIALDGITNPQNLGMILRSVAASEVDALILPKKGCTQISPLVIKASAGALFKANILYCDTLKSALVQAKDAGFQSYMLSSHAEHSLFDHAPSKRSIYVLGNETEGVSPAIEAICDHRLSIPMQNGVESLNVAITAALIAFTKIP